MQFCSCTVLNLMVLRKRLTASLIDSEGNHPGVAVQNPSLRLGRAIVHQNEEGRVTGGKLVGQVTKCPSRESDGTAAQLSVSGPLLLRPSHFLPNHISSKLSSSCFLCSLTLATSYLLLDCPSQSFRPSFSLVHTRIKVQ